MLLIKSSDLQLRDSCLDRSLSNGTSSDFDYVSEEETFNVCDMLFVPGDTGELE